MPGSSPDNDTQVSDTEVLDTADASQADIDTGTTDSSGAASSSPEPAGTMLDAVTAALEPKEASPSSTEPDPAAPADDPNAPKADSETEGELSPEELKALNWKTQQRFKKAYSTIKSQDAQIGELKTKAEDYDKIVGSITKAGLDQNQLNELVELGGALVSDPHAAYEKLVPIVNALREVIGETLPPELQERVRLGYISEQDARDLQRSKSKANLAERSAAQREADAKAEKEANERNTLIESSISAVEAWEKTQADKDPDWHLKRKDVAEQVELAIVREARKRNAPYFPTAEESVKLSTEALKTVNEKLKRFVPKPTEIRPATPGSSTRSKAAPKTTLDAINNAMSA